MRNTVTAKVQVEINAPILKVWEALVNPKMISQYMFGTNVFSNWQEGSGIIWKGKWEGKSYEDKGVLLKVQPGHILQYSHFSPLSGQPDVPENYHIVTIELATNGPSSLVTLSQDNNSTKEDREHSEQNWRMMLLGLKKLLES